MENLPDDVLERILQHSSDYGSLYSLILVSKRVYAVFQEYPQTTKRRIAWNLAGPALPQAIRAIRHPDNQCYDVGLEDVIDINASVETVEGPPLSQDEQKTLTNYSNCACKLEDIFSHRLKDRTCKTSKLNPLESWRFRRAVFRLILFSKIFNLSVYEYLIEDIEDDSDGNIERQSKARQAFFHDFYPEELVELFAVSYFLSDLSQWASHAGANNDDTNIRDLGLLSGPMNVLKAFETASPEPLTEDGRVSDAPGEFGDLVSGYVSQPLMELWERRKVTPPKTPAQGDNSLWYSILESVQEHDTCEICSGAQGTELWNESNWDYVQGLVDFRRSAFVHRLAGNLSFNKDVAQRFAWEVADTARHSSHYMAAILNEMFDLKSSDYSHWRKDSLVCTTCLTTFVQAHLHLWVLARKTAAGDIIKENCWYGYNCRTQTHNITHATKLNHLCAQSRS